MGFHAWLCDVMALARSWTSSDGWFQGERPADRRALEGAVAKAGRVSFKRGLSAVPEIQERELHTGALF